MDKEEVEQVWLSIDGIAVIKESQPQNWNKDLRFQFAKKLIEKFGQVSAATKPTANLSTKLPKWIDDLKGYDSTMDAMIEYIIELQSLLATKPAAPNNMMEAWRRYIIELEQKVVELENKLKKDKNA